MWDVAAQRQVELRGPDAGRLVQYLTPRNLSKTRVGQGRYVPLCDYDGWVINDPVLLKLADDLYWLSVADSDIHLWAAAIGQEKGWDVAVSEPDVSPLAIQGPKSEDVAAKLFGEHIRNFKYFGFAETDLNGIPLVLARSGWSKQGGFEIYMPDTALGMPLWNALMEAGQDLDVRAGCPNGIERIEGGLLSYGNDMDDDNTPHECGLGRFCNTQTAIGCGGRDALLRVSKEGPVKQVRPISIHGEAVPPSDRAWPIYGNGKKVGAITSAAWSPDFETNVAIGMVRMTHWDSGTKVEVETTDGMRDATVLEEFWI